jgi:hypothetical protein
MPYVYCGPRLTVYATFLSIELRSSSAGTGAAVRS